MHAAQQPLQRVRICWKHIAFLYVQHMGLMKYAAVRWRISCKLQAITFTHWWQTAEIHELALHDNSMLCMYVR